MAHAVVALGVPGVGVDDAVGVRELHARAVFLRSGRGGRGNRGARGGRGGRGGGAGAGAGRREVFIPTKLGVALIEGFDRMNFETSLGKPFLRKEVRSTFNDDCHAGANWPQMELRMKAICEGRKSKREVVQESIDQYRDVYLRAQRQLPVLQLVSNIRKDCLMLSRILC